MERYADLLTQALGEMDRWQRTSAAAARLSSTYLRNLKDRVARLRGRETPEEFRSALDGVTHSPDRFRAYG